MNKTLENVYVVIYSKKHLKEAIKWLQHYGQDIECDIRHDWENENNYLSINAGSFGLRQIINKEGYYEVSLNQLIEMVVDKESEEANGLEIGRWYVVDKDSEIWGGKALNDGVLCYKGDDLSFGMSLGGIWSNNFKLNCSYPIKREATHEEVEKILISEAKRRGFGKAAKFTMGEFEYSVPSIFHFKYFPKKNTFGVSHDKIKGLYPQIFINGKWAEIIKADKFADLKKARANGEEIQYLSKLSNGWVTDKSPSWNESYEYRIKPEPKVKMGDYVVTELKSDSVKGFYAHRIELQESADNLNREDALHNFKVITKEKFEELRKEAFD